MSRSAKKGPAIDLGLVKKVLNAKANNSRDAIKTWSRSCTVLPDFVGTTFAVHNGKDFISVFITENMVGHKLGEFSHTRIFRAHGGKKVDSAKK